MQVENAKAFIASVMKSTQVLLYPPTLSTLLECTTVFDTVADKNFKVDVALAQDSNWVSCCQVVQNCNMVSNDLPFSITAIESKICPHPHLHVKKKETEVNPFLSQFLQLNIVIEAQVNC